MSARHNILPTQRSLTAYDLALTVRDRELRSEAAEASRQYKEAIDRYLRNGGRM